MRAAVPPLRPRPVLHLADMGMHMGDDSSVQAMAGMDHSAMGHSSAEAVPAADDHGAMNMRDGCKVTFPVGVGGREGPAARRSDGMKRLVLILAANPRLPR